jgi:thioredoxin-dependent peroxiredoxin
MSRRMRGGPLLLAAALALATTAAGAQQSGAPATPAPVAGPQVGEMAPDFELPGASRYGLLRGPLRLSDFRGQTVIVAFFPKARTKG